MFHTNSDIWGSPSSVGYHFSAFNQRVTGLGKIALPSQDLESGAVRCRGLGAREQSLHMMRPELPSFRLALSEFHASPVVMCFPAAALWSSGRIFRGIGVSPRTIRPELQRKGLLCPSFMLPGLRCVSLNVGLESASDSGHNVCGQTIFYTLFVW